MTEDKTKKLQKSSIGTSSKPKTKPKAKTESAKPFTKSTKPFTKSSSKPFTSHTKSKSKQKGGDLNPIFYSTTPGTEECIIGTSKLDLQTLAPGSNRFPEPNLPSSGFDSILSKISPPVHNLSSQVSSSYYGNNPVPTTATLPSTSNNLGLNIASFTQSGGKKHVRKTKENHDKKDKKPKPSKPSKPSKSSKSSKSSKKGSKQ